MVEWHSLCCSDCDEAIAYSPIPMFAHDSVYCPRCAHSHAEVAGYLMPIGNGYSVNGLYDVQRIGQTEELKRQFDSSWRPICKAIQQHKVAKAKNK